MAGSFMGLLIGGLLADIDWRAVFLVSVPFGIFGTVWAYLKLRELGQRGQGRFDWAGNLTFGIGLIAVLVGITYGIQPYGGHTMGWTSPLVLAVLLGGSPCSALFVLIEHRVQRPAVPPRPVPDPRLHRRQPRRRCWPRSAAAACSSC